MSKNFSKYFFLIVFLFFIFGCEDEIDGLWSVGSDFGRVEESCLVDTDCSYDNYCDVDTNICVNSCEIVENCGEHGTCLVKDRKTPECSCNEGYVEDKFYKCVLVEE